MTKRVCDLCHKSVPYLHEVTEEYQAKNGEHQVTEVCAVCADLVNEIVAERHKHHRNMAVLEVKDRLRKLSYERKVNSTTSVEG